MPKLKSSRPSKSVEDYLKAIWLNSRDGPVATGTVAVSLGVSDASVSGMLGKLDDQGLVRYTRYHGAQLTASGERAALQLLRRHRLIEAFLIEYLGYGWGEVHGEAEALEHAVSDLFTERLAALLGHPTHDPHGDPIPKGDGALPDTPDTPLTEAALDRSFLVSRLKTQDANILSYLTELGIYPGQRVEVQCCEPVGGLVKVAIGGNPNVLANELAVLIRGEVVV